MTDLQISKREVEIILQELDRVIELTGDVVEFGCYAGDTSIELARVLQETPDKWLYLYDSFEGLPEKTAADNSADGWRFKAGELKVSADTVAHKFKKYRLPDPVIIKSWFDELEDSDLPQQICFALLDGDFYESIKASLRLVASKITDGGIIIVHDYRNTALPGSAKAVNEFLEQNPNFSLKIRATMAILTKN